jgi:hypothetical protein
MKLTHSIDCHIIGSSPWIEQCLASLDGEPINLRRVSAVTQSTGTARMMGFSQGDAPLVSLVDPDDEIVPGAFGACLQALEEHQDAVGAYTDEELVDERGRHIRPGKSTGTGPWNLAWQLSHVSGIHHLTVMRRGVVERYLSPLCTWHILELHQLYAALARHGPWIHVPRLGYRWRQHPGGIHRCATPAMVLDAVRSAATLARSTSPLPAACYVS